jgi:predicted AAA+ superfamily ATPase
MASMPNWSGYFYRSSSGDEIDLILEKGTRKIAIECKASSSPQLTKGFYNAINDLKPDEVFVVAPIHDTYKINEIITVCGLHEFLLLQK